MRPPHSSDTISVRIRMVIDGFSQDDVVAAKEHRHVSQRDVETVQQLLDALFAIQIDLSVWMAVAGKELTDA
jgi:hypothetical protein